LRTPISYAIGVPPPMTEVQPLSPTLGFVPSEPLARRASLFEGGFSEGGRKELKHGGFPSPTLGFVPSKSTARRASPTGR
ncbi:MAG: hypothetical protein ACI3XR_01835, partial [Eubacteriales bacterium]